MIKIIKNPNLPENDVSHLILGEKYKELLDAPLKQLGIIPVYMPDNPLVDPRVSGHADLSILHLSGGLLYLAPYLKNSKLAEELKELGFYVYYPDIVQRKEYPHDAQLNICIAGNTAIARKDSDTADNIIEKMHFNAVRCRQGYCRCTTCVLDEQTFITSDQGIYKELSSAERKTLLITNGYIELPGYDYGFIGGSGFKISKNKIAFTGNFNSHPDKEKIISFIDSYGFTPVFLTDYSIFDIGTAIPITEQA